MAMPSLPVDVVTLLVEAAVGNTANPGDIELVSAIAPLLRDIALWRTSVSTHIVTQLCNLATHQRDDIRDVVLSELEAILISGGDLSDSIVVVGKTHLEYLTLEQPPATLFADYLGRPDELKQWDEATVKACLNLPFAILPTHQSLIHE